MPSILDMLAQQPPAILSQLVKRARALMALNGAKDEPEQVADPYAWLLEGIRIELKRRKLLAGLPLKVIQDSRHYKQKFAPCAPAMGEWLAGLLPEDATRTDKLALSCLAARCLAQYVSRFTEVSMENLLWYYPSLPAAIERNFPGYCRQGLIPLLLAQKPRKR
jgi:hypothetical protein